MVDLISLFTTKIVDMLKTATNYETAALHMYLFTVITMIISVMSRLTSLMKFAVIGFALSCSLFFSDDLLNK